MKEVRLAHLDISKNIRYGLYLKALDRSFKKFNKLEVHSQIFISAADFPLRVGRVDEPLRVAVHEAVDGDGRPAADEGEEEEEAEDVGARAALDGAAELGVVVALLPVLVLIARSVEVLDAVAAPHGGHGIGPAACGGGGENKASVLCLFSSSLQQSQHMSDVVVSRDSRWI